MNASKAGNPPFYIHLDLPASFRGKAKYALNTLLSGYNLSPRYTDRDTVLRQGGLWYGLQTALPENGDKGIICIQSRPETWAYFESGRAYSLSNAIRITTPDDSSHKDVPVLFGEKERYHKDNVYYLGADLVASSFFWLSDWQERYVTTRDEHGRIPYAASVQHRLGVAQRPLVNEYAQILAKCGSKLDQSWDRRRWISDDFALCLTFDLDNLRKNRITSTWASAKELWKSGESGTQWKKLLKQTTTPGDPTYKSIKKIFDRLYREKWPATFFLKSIVERSNYDARDYLNVGYFSDVIQHIVNDGHELGFHSSYRAGVEPMLLEEELAQLKEYAQVDQIKAHRSHYLRYDCDIIIDELNEAQLTIDSSLGWADQIGFRTGCCWPHRWYDHKTGQVSNIWEIPMTVMDIQLMSYMRLNKEQAIERICNQIDTIRNWQGIAVWNFHHNLYDPVDAPGWSEVFERSLAYAQSHQPTVTTVSELIDLWIQKD